MKRRHVPSTLESRGSTGSSGRFHAPTRGRKGTLVSIACCVSVVVLAGLAASVSRGATLESAGAAASAATTGTVGNGFTVTPGDLSFILKQIKIAEHHAATATPADPCGTLIGPGPDQIPDALTSYGLRTVDGSCNNLEPGRETFAAADVPFPRLTNPVFRDAEAGTSYAQKATGNVVQDSRPRTISNLIVDQTSSNPAAIVAAEFPVRSQNNPGLFPCTTDPGPNGVPAGIPANCVPSHETLFIPNVTTDVGLSPPYNSLFTFFGQFFDHGVDQTVKSGGVVVVPLKDDDPLVAGPDHIFGNADDLPVDKRFMVLTRAQNQPGPDGVLGTPDDITNTNNTDTPWVDQSQTYTSHSAHQVFLREYELNGAGHPVSTGKLLGGSPANAIYPGSADGTGGIGTWFAVKQQASAKLGLWLQDKDVTNIPMILADPYGNFIPGPNGFPQYVTTHGLVEGDPSANAGKGVAVPGDVLHFDTPFLTDVAHQADPSTQPGPDNVPGTADDVTPVPDADNVSSGADFASQPAGTYDDELLNSHFICGDGRCNENIALSSIHTIFHSEHDRLVDYIKNVLDDPANADLKAAYLAPHPLNPPTDNTDISFGIGGRLFQAARFVTEMEYQHLVFEEFARKLAPAIHPFHVYSPDVNPAIPAEFAHAVYRFGHSMLDDTVARTVVAADGTKTDGSLPLLTAFLNPPSFFDGRKNLTGPAVPLTAAQAVGAVVMGSSDQVGNELDEFVADTLRNNLLGLPLDLATLNLTRARDAGIPPLNQVRRQIFQQTNDGQMAPYTSWSDFGQHLKHPESLINFVAAYGTHPSITSEPTLAGKRAAARAIVDPAPTCLPAGSNTPAGCLDNPPPVPADAADFMFSTGAWVPTANGVTTTGLDEVDLWVGGLAEVQNLNGGLLGSTFNYVFQLSLEKLQDGDRFYYLNRTPGMNLRSQLEGNSFAELIMRNTDGTNSLKADAFATADCKFQLANLNGTPAGFAANGATVTDDPATKCREDLLLTRAPNGTISYQARNTVDPPGINGQAVYNGTDGVDRIKGGVDNDTFWGGLGNDVIDGQGGDDVTLGGFGNDIITDLDGADVLKGGPGNDAIDGGTGDDIVTGGDGQDFTNGGANDNETFAGPGSDFINAGQGADAVFGDGGDDWIQGGTGQDLLQGDHGAPFFDDPAEAAPGNDIFVGQPGENDYDAEGGDDIMMQNDAIDRNAGAGGFDWAIHQMDTAGANDDMMINANLGGLPIQVIVNRDRWQETEADSGSKFNDVIKGTDGIIGTPRMINTIPSGFQGCDVLDHAGVARIKGLDQLVGTPENPLLGDVNLPQDVAIFGPTGGQPSIMSLSSSLTCPLSGAFWGEGDIELGGPGSDTFIGRGGNDIIDGDKWLNVAISVRANADGTGPELGRTDLMEGFPKSIAGVDGGTFGPGTTGMNLQQAVFAGLVDPGQLVMVREISNEASLLDVDTSVYTGARSDYSINRNPDGSISICDNRFGIDLAGAAFPHEAGKGDGCDTLWHIEKLQFTDVTIDVSTIGAPPAAPAVATAPTAAAGVTFPGTTTLGATSAAQTVTVTNSGNAPLNFTTITATGDFAVSGGGTCAVGTAVAAGANCTITITFTPTATGARTGSLSIADNAPGSPQSVPLTGTGAAVPAPVVSLSPTTLGFGSQNTGTTSAAQSVTVTNSGNAPLNFTTITATGDFAVSGGGTCAVGTAVAAGASCTVSVTFSPTTTGAKTASVSIASNAAGSPHSVALTGAGVAPALSVSPASLTFGSQTVNTTSAAQTLTVTNSGTAPLLVGAVTKTGTALQAAEFTVSANTCNNVTVAPNSTCSISVTFRPTATGTQTAGLSIPSNAAGSPASVALSGTGAPLPTTTTLSATSAAFPAQRINTTSGNKTVTIKNTGANPLIVNPAIVIGFGPSASMGGANPTQFTVVSTTCNVNIAPKGSCTINFAFRPTTVGAKTATFTFASNVAGSPQSVTLSGSGK